MSKKEIIFIEIIYKNWGIVKSDEISKYSLKIVEEEVDIKYYSLIINLPVESYHYNIDKEKTKDFFTKLITDVKVLEWKEDYTVPVCDGFHYDINIIFKDGSIKKTQGTIKPPENADLLQKMIDKLIPYKGKPEIF